MLWILPCQIPKSGQFKDSKWSRHKILTFSRGQKSHLRGQKSHFEFRHFCPKTRQKTTFSPIWVIKIIFFYLTCRKNLFLLILSIHGSLVASPILAQLKKNFMKRIIMHYRTNHKKYNIQNRRQIKSHDYVPLSEKSHLRGQKSHFEFRHFCPKTRQKTTFSPIWVIKIIFFYLTCRKNLFLLILSTVKAGNFVTFFALFNFFLKNSFR